MQYADAQRCMFGELLVKYGIKKRFNINQVDFNVTEYGKPYVSKYTNIHFNISHSGDWVVCAINDEIIGIDIEQIKPIDINIAKRFFSEHEYHSLLLVGRDKKEEYFYRIWTLKELY